MTKFNFTKRIVLTLGIVVVLNLFFNYGISTFYHGPKYDNFCAEELLSKQYVKKDTCEEAGGFWTERGRIDQVPVMMKTLEPTGVCDMHHTCRKAYQTVQDIYNRNVFVTLVILGLFSIIGGLFVITQSEAVSSGFSFGGILSIVIGSMRYWSAMDDYLRFIILGIALAILVWMGIKKFGDVTKTEKTEK